MKQPNIVLILTDDQRFDTLGALGNSAIHTPNMDQLVQEGVAFTQAHIPGGTCGAVCMPSRAMLHTGRQLFSVPEHGEEIQESHALLGEVLQNNGYTTYGTGKWHNGVDAFKRSFTHGGHVFFGGMADHWNVPVYSFQGQGEYKMQPIIHDFIYTRDVHYRCCDHMHMGEHSTDLFMKDAREFIEGYDSENPFFMYVALMAPHDPRSMPKEYKDMYSPETTELPPNYANKHEFTYGVEDIRDELLATYPREEAEIKEHIAEYYGMISHIDAELGKVMDTLKEKNLMDNTIIIFTADNGLAVGQHGLMGKQSCYEHSVRVPLIMKGPGIKENERSSAFVYLYDIFPTLCELIEIEAPESTEGDSFKLCLEDTEEEHRQELYLVYGDFCRGLKDHQYKYIEYRNNGVVHEQLFDLLADKWETMNLADKSEYQEVKNTMKQGLSEISQSNGDRQHPQGITFWNN